MTDREKDLVNCLRKQLDILLDLGMKTNYSCLTDSDGLIERLQDNIFECFKLIGTVKTEKDIMQEKLYEDFPDFAKHEKILQENKIIKITANGYDWLLSSKKSLADYFADTAKNKENIHWKLVESLFTWQGEKVTNLRGSYQSNHKKNSLDFEYIKSILKN